MTTPLVDRLHQLAESSAPGPDPAFVARLGAELRHMEQVPVMSERRPAARRAPWGRFLALAVPAGAIALAGAFVALRPAPSRPHQVRTAGPGVSTPAPDTNQLQPGESMLPPVTEPHSLAPTTVVPGAAHAPTTQVTQPTRHLVVPGPDQSPATTVATTTPRQPATTTTTAPRTTETLSLHCTGGTETGSPAVTCTWSSTTSGAFKSYRLSREKPGTNRVIVFTSDSRTAASYADHDVQPSTGYSYWIEALDASGTVIGRGTATVTCC